MVENDEAARLKTEAEEIINSAFGKLEWTGKVETTSEETESCEQSLRRSALRLVPEGDEVALASVCNQ